MVYVAFSRVRRLSDIYIDKGAVSTNILQQYEKRVLDFMDRSGILNA